MPMPGVQPTPTIGLGDGQAKAAADKVLVDFQVVSRCLTRVQEAESLLVVARSALSEAVAEEKVNEGKACLAAPYTGSYLSTISTTAGATPDSQSKAVADVQWESMRSNFGIKDKDKDKVPVKTTSSGRADQAQAAAPCDNGGGQATPKQAPSNDVPKLKTGRSKWSNIDRQGLVDQVVINGVFLDNQDPEAQKGSSSSVDSVTAARSGDPTEPMVVKVRGVEWIPTCWGRTSFPVINPSSHIRIGWLLMGFCFIIYEAFAIPYCLAYDVQAEGFWYYVVSFINAYFLLDILMSFVTGYIDNQGITVMEPHRIVYRYVTGWFVLDIIAGIPWEWVSLDSGAASFTRGIRFIRAFRLVRLTRLLRLLRTNVVTEKLEIYIEANQAFMFLVGLSRILFLLFGVTHWMACAWYAVGIREVSAEDNTWVKNYLGDYGEDKKFARYIYSLYFTLTTMTTVGYGDMSAQNLEETMFVLGLLLVASIVFAGLMGVLTDLISTLNVEKNSKNDRKAQLSRYMQWRAVPTDLFLTIRQHILFLWDENEGYETYEEEIKTQLSPALKTELCFHIYGRLLYSSPFFAWMKDYSECLKQLSTMVQSLFLSRGDMLFRIGQKNEQIYLLLSGSVWLSRNQSLHQTGPGNSAPMQADMVLESGPQGFTIPRKHEAGFQDVRKKINAKTVLRTSAVMTRKAEGVLHLWRRSSEHRDLANEERELAEAHANRKKMYKGVDLCGNAIFDSPVLMEATVQLKRRDVREKNAVLLIQRRWRRRALGFGVAKQLSKQMSRYKASALTSKTVSAPAYFGESCLWRPMDQWGTEDPPLYTYTVRCEARCELVYIAREAIQETVERFSPWLGERHEVFRQSVVQQLSEVMREGEAGHKDHGGSFHGGDFQPYDWASMDLLPPQDDVSMNASHCKTLLRAAVPSRTQMTILRSAATHSRPAMPRTSSYIWSERGSRLHRMPSGLLGERR